MENVKGLLSARIGNDRVIDLITKDLQSPNAVPALSVLPLSRKKYSYRLFSLVKEADEDALCEPSDYIIKCEDYGIPQRRHRVIIMGVREDYLVSHFHILTKHKTKITLKNTIYDLPECFSTFSSRQGGLSIFDQNLLKYNDWQVMIQDYFSKEFFDERLNAVILSYIGVLGQKKRGRKPSVFLPEWFLSNGLGGHHCNHEPRSHMRSDFLRYFFVSCFGEAYGRSPRLDDFPQELLPAHENVDANHFVDRFKVQLKDIPSTTVTCHISKDGHYYIHPDPRQCRSLSVREGARLQTFPDHYFFCGNKTQQYHQVGNAVPPLLARQIAGVVYEILKQSGG